ncbi:FG-GAP repeat protein [Marinomonas sp. S3726]|uniref:FG-GAP repeat protein n=1 Tax=Marinomonas sp. S3726 TaxID=579484 RepID=UPI000699000B|nr:FG-GAP repeat protein [Marinomonas sp. S3726]
MRKAIFIAMTFILTACGGSSETNNNVSGSSFTLGFSSIKSFDFSWQAQSGATHYKLLENKDSNSGFIQVGTDISSNTLSYSHLVPLYSRINAQYILQSCNASECIDSDTLSVNNALTDSIGYVKASNTDNDDNFGKSLSLSGDGSTLAVGAYAENSSSTDINGDQTDNTANNAGAVYIFDKSSSGDWTQHAYLKASNAEAGDFFGFSVSLTSDGNTLAVGAVLEDSSSTGINGDQINNAAIDSGAVYLYSRDNNNVWSQQAYIKASNTDSEDYFGENLKLSSDGSTLTVSASSEDSSSTGINNIQTDNTSSDSGAVFVFTRGSNDIWSQQAYIKSSNTGSGDLFGSSVSLSSDGNLLAVGALDEDSGSTGINGDQMDNSTDGSGAVYIFSRDTNALWTQQAYLKASFKDKINLFGDHLALSADASTLAVSSPYEDSDSIGVNGDQTNKNALYSGAVYIFTKDMSNNWEQEAYIKASNTQTDDQFGYHLDISSDGNILAVSAISESGNTEGLNGDQNDNSQNKSGAVYTFVRNGTVWSQQAYLKASNTDKGDKFGEAVSLAADGSILAVGAYLEDSNAIGINGEKTNNNASASGAVYLY